MDTAHVTEGTIAPERTRDQLLDDLSVHGPILLATARVITLDDQEAQDLVQATFEIALRNLDQLSKPAALRAWLLRIETREAFRVVRRLRRLVSLDGHVREVPAMSVDLAQRPDIRTGLDRLPRRIRAAIALHYLADLTVPETARALGVTENTIKSQIKTGLARLREDLRDG